MTTDELRAKFENWWLRNGDPFDLHKVTARETWQAAHASRDAEVEALRKDAERYRWLRDAEPTKRWNDAIDTLERESGHEVDAAIDAAMREVE